MRLEWNENSPNVRPTQFSSKCVLLARASGTSGFLSNCDSVAGTTATSPTQRHCDDAGEEIKAEKGEREEMRTVRAGNTPPRGYLRPPYATHTHTHTHTHTLLTFIAERGNPSQLRNIPDHLLTIYYI